MGAILNRHDNRRSLTYYSSYRSRVFLRHAGGTESTNEDEFREQIGQGFTWEMASAVEPCLSAHPGWEITEQMMPFLRKQRSLKRLSLSSGGH